MSARLDTEHYFKLTFKLEVNFKDCSTFLFPDASLKKLSCNINLRGTHLNSHQHCQKLSDAYETLSPGVSSGHKYPCQPSDSNTALNKRHVFFSVNQESTESPAQQGGLLVQMVLMMSRTVTFYQSVSSSGKRAVSQIFITDLLDGYQK